MTATLNDQPIHSKPNYKFAWMFGRNNDLIFFFAPIFLSLALYLLLQSHVLAAGVLMAFVFNGVGLNQLHLGPSWYFYLDKRNIAYWKEHKNKAMLFFAGPPLIMLVSILLGLIAPGINYLVTTLWGMQHFIQQNFGILILYHNPKSGEAMASRNLQNRSLWAASLFFILFYFERLMLKGQYSLAFAAVAAIFAIGAIFYCGLYIIELRKQIKAGASLNVPALMFWLMSVFYFAPFALLTYDASTAFVVPGVLHWTQYLFLNYMLVKYKYKDDASQSQLPINKPILLFNALAILLVIISFSIWGVRYSGHVNIGLVMGILFGISNVHYFQDAFLWRFREQFQRESIMPYLIEAKQHESGQAG